MNAAPVVSGSGVLEVMRYRNVADLVNNANPIYLSDKEYAKTAMRIWKKIYDLFVVYATMRQLPSEVDKWYVIGRCDSSEVLASSPFLAPYKPPKYIAFRSGNEVLVIDSRVNGYRKIYVRILRMLSKATVVKTSTP